MNGPRAVRGASGLVAGFALLELLTRTRLIDPELVPPASTILATTARILLDGDFLANVGATLAASALGLAVAVLVGVPLGLLLGSSRWRYLAGITAVELLRPIPSVALIPLVVLLLGRGLDMKLVVVAYAATWPILLNTIYGIHQVDPLARETGRAFGLGRMAVLMRISLPSAAPFIYTGIRIAAAIALILAISAELIAGGGLGIGTWMLAGMQAGVGRELVYAAVVVTGLLGLLIDATLIAGGRRLFAWHPRAEGTA